MEVDGPTLFTASTLSTGFELWRSDGTAGDTVLVRAIKPGLARSGPTVVGTLGGKLLLTAEDRVHGRDLCVSDGTEEGTRLLEDINPDANSNLIIRDAGGWKFSVDSRAATAYKHPGFSGSVGSPRDLSAAGRCPARLRFRGGAVRKAVICSLPILTLLASATLAQAQVSCLDDGFQRVFGNMSQHTNANQGNPPQPQDTCTTGITFLRGEVMQVCAKGTVELNAVKTVMPEGGIPSTGSGWRYPGAPEGALLGIIGNVIFPLGRCASIPAPAAGVLSLVVNDESGAYVDNTGSFKVLVSNLATGEGSTVGASTFAVVGVSTPMNWSFGFGAAAAGGPTIAPLAVNVVNTVAGGAGPAGLDTLFVNGVNDPVAGFGARLDPACTCASCGPQGDSGPALGATYGCPIAGASFTVLNGGAALFMYTGPAGGPAAAPCGGPVGAPGAPATPGAVGTCPFNPTLLGGVGLLLGSGNPSIPALSPVAMVLLIGLIVGAGAYLIMRRRSSQLTA